MGPTPARAIMRTVAYCVSLSAFLIADLTLCGKAPGLIGVIFLIWLPFSCVIWGVIYFRSFSVSVSNYVPAEACLIIGFWLTSLSLLLPVFFSPSFYLTAFLFMIWNGIALYFLFQIPDRLGVLDLRWSNLWLLLVTGLTKEMIAEISQTAAVHEWVR